MQTKLVKITILPGKDSLITHDVLIRTEDGNLKSRMLRNILRSLRSKGELKLISIPAILTEELLDSREELKKEIKAQKVAIHEMKKENEMLQMRIKELEKINRDLANIGMQFADVPSHLIV